MSDISFFYVVIVVFPGEHNNLSEDPAHSTTLKSMLDRLEELKPSLFNPNRGNITEGSKLAQSLYFGKYRGFAGPFLFLDNHE